jgi:putative ABC transport system permease protein
VPGDGLRRGLRRFFRIDVRRIERTSAESDEELTTFLDARIEDLVARGMTPTDARAEAIRRLGGKSLESVQVALRCSSAKRERKIHMREWMDDFRADLRIATRALWRELGYSLVVALALSLGIGSASATFAAFHHVLLAPLPVRDQAGLAVLTVENTALLDTHVGITYRLLSELGSRSHTITAIAGVPAALAAAPYAARDGDRIVQLALTATTGNFFQVLGTAPQQGQLLEAADDEVARGPVAVLSYSAWQRVFGGRSNIIGHEVTFNVGAFTIIGVAPEEFDYPHGTDIWVSDAAFMRLAGYPVKPDDGYWDALIRLGARQGIHEASRELAASVKDSEAPLLGPRETRTVLARSFTEVVVGNQRDALILFSAAVALVLVVSCTNVAGLLLARGFARAREIAVRKALGATTQRIVRQLMVENLLLAVIGGALGAACARILLAALTTLAPPELARMDQVRVDPTVAGFATVLTLFTAIAFGLVPALSAARATPQVPLQSESRSHSAGLRAVRAREWLVICQVALAVVILTSAGLLVRNLARLQHLALGFDPSHLLLVYIEQLDVANGSDANAGEARHTAVIEGLVERLKAMSHIENATSVDAIPFSVVAGTGGLDVHYALEGQPYSAGMSSPRAGFNVASKDYFATLRIPLLRGRTLTTADRTGNQQVAVVSEAFANRAWRGRNPIGQQLRFLNDGAVGLWRTVVGMVADTKYHDFLSDRPEVYIPLYQSEPGPFIAVRTNGEPMDVLPLARDALHGLDQGYGIAKAVSAEQLLESRLARPKFLAATVVVLAATVAILAAVGLFGVLSFAIRQRRREFGIRLAHGATAAHLRSLVFRSVARLTVVGAALGFAIGIPAAEILRHEIVGISIVDSRTLAAVLVVLFTTMALAAALPVARAARVDPVSALRE